MGSQGVGRSGGPYDDEVSADGTARTPRWLTVLAALVLVAGLVVFGVFGWRYLQAREAQELATDRETVTEVASQVIINAFSFDHRHVDDSLRQLSEVSTGDFLAEQEQWSADVRERVVEQKAVTNATVSHAALEEIDREAGTAAVLVVFTAHSEREGEDPITGRQAMRVELTREDESWKATAVEQVGVTVPVGESSRSVQELQDPGALTGEGEGGSAGAGSDAAPGGGADGSAEQDTTTAPAPRGGR